MQNKKLFLLSTMLCCLFAVTSNALAEEFFEEFDMVEYSDDMDMEQMSAASVQNYQVNGSLFQQITDLEQEKILMQLEKERAQLDLELDRLAAEKIKLHMEIDTLSERAEQQQQEIETQKAKLEAEAVRLEREKEHLLAEVTEEKAERKAAQEAKEAPKPAVSDLTQMYRLVNVIGAGSQLQATVSNLSTGQTKRISVGKDLDGYKVKSISIEDGVVFVDKNGETQTLNVTSGSR